MNTSEPRIVRVEAVADLPVLWATFQRLDLPATLDRHFPAPLHWKGPLTPGEILSVWLLFLVSQGDHCLNHVQPWVAQHQGTLSALLGKRVLPTDAHDDRLADWLARLGAGAAFSAMERDLSQQTVRVYELPTDLVRIDTTTANSYAAVLSEQGLLQFGHSKDDPDRPQLKIAAAILDPLGLPLATPVVPGNTAYGHFYITAIQAVQQSLGAGSRTYVGDCKMAALATRAFVVAGGDFYLCPLPETQLSRAERRESLRPVWDGAQALAQVWRPGLKGQPDELVAEGFAVDLPLTAWVGEKEVRWKERRWLVRSQAYAQSQEAVLERRLATATADLSGLPTRTQGKKRLFHAELMRAAAAIVTREGVTGLVSYINAESVCALLLRSVAGAAVGLPITLVLDNARYQKCAVVQALASSLAIELLYLPSYSPNLNLIERLWRFVRKQSLDSTYYEDFGKFVAAIDGCLDGLHTVHKREMRTLMTHKFQTF
jgi:DDE superfamily endonuclease